MIDVASGQPRVLLVGHDFVPRRSSGDKNFWLALLAHLGTRTDWLGVASIVHGEPAHRMFAVASAEHDLFAIEPVYALTRLCADRQPHPPKCAGAFKRQPASLVDHPLTLLRHGRRLRDIVARHEIDVVHFMDNVGLAAGLTRWLQPRAAVTMTYLGFYTVNTLRSHYLSACARLASGLVVGNRLIGEALRPYAGTDAAVIPWGIETPAVDVGDRLHARAVLEHHYGLTGRQLVLWTGHTQQLGDAELHAARAAALSVTAADPSVEAVFLLKPECHPDRYRHLATDRIRFCSSADAPAFTDHLLAADVLLAPVSRTDTIVTPPLTWIEAMQKGTPVVSTDTPGVSDALGPHQRSFIAHLTGGSDELAAVLTGALAGVTTLDREHIAAWARRAYSLDRSAAAYADFWGALMPEERRP